MAADPIRLSEVRVRLVRHAEVERFNALLQEHHYLGFRKMAGRRLASRVLGLNLRQLAGDWLRVLATPAHWLLASGLSPTTGPETQVQRQLGPMEHRAGCRRGLPLHRGQQKPSGQRSGAKHSRHASSAVNHASNFRRFRRYSFATSDYSMLWLPESRPYPGQRLRIWTRRSVIPAAIATGRWRPSWVMFLAIVND